MTVGGARIDVLIGMEWLGRQHIRAHRLGVYMTMLTMVRDSVVVVMASLSPRETSATGIVRTVDVHFRDIEHHAGELGRYHDAFARLRADVEKYLDAVESARVDRAMAERSRPVPTTIPSGGTPRKGD